MAEKCLDAVKCSVVLLPILSAPAAMQPDTSPAPTPPGNLRPLGDFKKERVIQFGVDYRFVREVERLEREGFVERRAFLEKAIGLPIGSVTDIRAGKRGIGVGHIVLLQKIYLADFRYILFGQRIPYTTEELYLLDRLPHYEPIQHVYSASARWRIGPMAETHPDYYPPDPENKHWKAIRRTAKGFVKEEEELAS